MHLYPTTYRSATSLKFTDHRQRALFRYLRREAHDTATLTKLSDAARRWLYDRQILLPGRYSLLDVVRRAQAEVETQLLNGVRCEMGQETLARWETELFKVRAGASTLGW